MKEFTIKDIEKMIILVEIDSNCHQVILTGDQKETLKLFISTMSDGMRLTPALEDVRLEIKK